MPILFLPLELLIVTGIKVKKPWNDVVRGESVGPSTRVESSFPSVEEQVVEELNSRGVSVSGSEISACHTLGKRQEDGSHKVIIRFVSRKSKVSVLSDARKLKGTKIFINEHLTKKNAELAKTARDLKKAGKIAATWTRDCKVWVKNKDGTETRQVRCSADLARF